MEWVSWQIGELQLSVASSSGLSAELIRQQKTDFYQDLFETLLETALERGTLSKILFATEKYLQELAQATQKPSIKWFESFRIKKEELMDVHANFGLITVPAGTIYGFFVPIIYFDWFLYNKFFPSGGVEALLVNPVTVSVAGAISLGGLALYGPLYIHSALVTLEESINHKIESMARKRKSRQAQLGAVTSIGKALSCSALMSR